MPGISALEILKRLKADNIRKRIFLIPGKPFVEKKIAEENVSDLVEAVIPKPLRFTVLLDKLKGE